MYYKDGNIRILTKFLLFPMTINNEFRWLELASFEQKLCLDYGGDWYWENIKWINQKTLQSLC